MSIEIKVPVLPESVADATIATWHVQPGDQVSRDDNLVDIETDKVVLEVPAPEDGRLVEIVHAEGDTVLAEQVIARFEAGSVASAEPVAQAAVAEAVAASSATETEAAASTVSELHAGPSARRAMHEKGLDNVVLQGSGVGGRVTRDDVEGVVNAAAPSVPVAAAPAPAAAPALAEPAPVVSIASERAEKRVPMTRLRKRIAERLLEAKQSTAMLTTFNEVDMQPIMQIRKQYQEQFEKRHGVRIGFMSFYVKAVVEALKRYPEVNAAIDGDDLVYHNYFDISIAVSSPRGLVTPVLRDADQMSLADIEKAIKHYAVKAKEGKLAVEDMMGGNFTITNGGVFGSLMSTPIINPPQSAILGMHKIQDRPVAIDGKVEIRPMMYLALSYDHRIIDGRESVGFLVTIKELLEDPTRLLLDV